MNRARRIILPIVMAAVLTLITCIPIFAVDSNEDYLKYPPSDLGNEITAARYYIGYYKYYMKLDLTLLQESSYIQFRYYINDQNTGSYSTTITYSNNKLTIQIPNNNEKDYSFIVIPLINTDVTNVSTIYIPFYGYNLGPYTGYGTYDPPPVGITYYISNVTDQNIIIQEAFDVGYQNGYKNGYKDGEYAEQYTNITGYVTELLSKFVGSEYAEYLTPISIVLVILMVYFLFIRFLLSMIKAKGVMKTCDIIMITACIILLVVMYAPKLNLTIKTEQITTETTSTISENVEVIRTREYETIHTETGDIWVGPAGTILFPDVETTDSGQRATESVDVSTSIEGERE